MAPTSPEGDYPVRVEEVWKKFSRGPQHDSLRDLVPSALRGLGRALGLGAAATENGPNLLKRDEFWALREISFRVRRGEATGIIGRNGAGKSTMLKLLTRLLRPDLGRITLDGRVSALIEVGAGFHLDLSGRENIYLHGAIMGMRREEIVRKFDAIVEFAGVGEFLDMPIKRFSTGMNARLGFSVAAHLDPEILLIDEVLSVGDMAFQQRCIERMTSFKRQGVTILFVSHDLQAVRRLCDTAVWLDCGIRATGATAEVIAQYVSPKEKPRLAEQAVEIQILSAALRDSEGVPAAEAAPGDALALRVRYEIHQSLSDLTLGFSLHRSMDNLLVYDGHFPAAGLGVEEAPSGAEVTIDFRFRCHLTRGQYYLVCRVLHNPTRRHLSVLSPAALLTVHDTRVWGGVADLEVAPVEVGREGLVVVPRASGSE